MLLPRAVAPTIATNSAGLSEGLHGEYPVASVILTIVAGRKADVVEIDPPDDGSIGAPLVLSANAG